jgi:hypothetical protein
MSFAARLRSSFGAPYQRVSLSALVGYDLFISYRRSDATPYAAALFEVLRRADFRCFLDDNDATPGQPLTDKLQWALKRSKVLLIVASPDLPVSIWVPKEVEIFAKSRRDIILINVKDGMTPTLESSTLGPLLNKDAINLGEVRHVALAADGKVALVEGGGKILLVDLDPVSWRRKAQQLISG